MGDIDLLGKSLEELERLLEEEGKARFRARQIFRWIYRRQEDDFDRMTDLSLKFRGLLKEKYHISSLTPGNTSVSKDGTLKFLFSLQDGSAIETVMIPDGSRRTLCISTQAGCRMGCTFCATGNEGFVRSLSSSEIIGQVCHVERFLRGRGETITNVVFMGMGEPLDNLSEVLKAIGILKSVLAFSISRKRITVSTCGLLTPLKELVRRTDVSLAISLNGADDEVRDSIMPVNRRYPLSRLMEFIRGIDIKSNRKITLEYVLLGGINDREIDATRLAGLIKHSRIKVNLIPFNPYPGNPVGYFPPEPAIIDRFRDILIREEVQVITREKRGGDIESACGQLRGKLLKRSKNNLNSHVTLK